MTKKVTVELDNDEDEVEQKEVAKKDQYFVKAGYSSEWFDDFEKAAEYAKRRVLDDGVDILVLKPVAEAKAPLASIELEKFV